LPFFVAANLKSTEEMKKKKHLAEWQRRRGLCKRRVIVFYIPHMIKTEEELFFALERWQVKVYPPSNLLKEGICSKF